MIIITVPYIFVELMKGYLSIKTNFSEIILNSLTNGTGVSLLTAQKVVILGTFYIIRRF